ncbi:unnamed protein product [Rhizoctonia solani]|nr:unnamed protein product [Rhizoctonia solani]
MWISGQAGMGKTSVATSLCRYLDSIQALAGSFCCRHNDSNTNDPLALVNGLIYEIAARLPPYAHEVANAIRTNRTLCNAHFRLRYEGLIKGPLKRLKSLSTSTTLILIVDALDECGHDSRKKTTQILHNMSQLVPWLKVIITSRPEVDIVEYFRDHCAHQPVVHLQNYDASSDIRVYIQYKLGDLAKKEQWPDHDIDQLGSLAQGVFLWAALATKYITKSSILARSRLQKTLVNQKSPVTDHFDALYTRALQAAMKDDNDETKEAYHWCIGAILATSERKPLSIPNLQRLLSQTGRIEEGTLENIVENLGPLVLVTGGQYVEFYHPSFKDYITDPLRSNDLRIQLDLYKARFTNCCLTFMLQQLRFNICELESSHLLNSEVPDLEARINSHIGPVLNYACIHWIDHFVAAPNQTLVEVISKFMEGPQFLYWIEVLSLLGCVDIGVTGLSRLASLTLINLPGWSLIVSWAKDAHRFLLSFYAAISASTPHLYVSALAFAPIKSLTAQRMRSHFPNTVSIVKGGNVNWHPCINTIFHSHAVQSLSISPDGLTIATGHSDGSVCLWDMWAGNPIFKALINHSTSVTSVAFSPCGRFVASSSYDSEIRVSTTLARDEPGYILVGHSSSVHSIAFSPVASLIASGSSDKTIRLWDTKSMQPIGMPYFGHTNRVSSVIFSPDGTKLASGSWDKTIRIWSVDQDCLRLIENPLLIAGHSDSVTCVKFSLNGSRLISGSVDETLRMWNVQDGMVIKSPSSPAKHFDSITSISYSSDGRFIASSSLDGGILLWNAETLALVSRPFGHSSAVISIGFSPDGRYIASGSSDMTTRAWEINACPKSLHTAPFIGHSSTVYAVAVFSDGTRFVSASADHTMREWDAQIGTSIGDPYIGHSNNVFWVALSPDETFIASSSYDKTMKLWNTNTHAVVNTYQHGSIIHRPVFSPDGALIAFGADDNVYLWESVGWKMVGEALKGHSKLVTSVAFSPDGAVIASASMDHTIQLWIIKTHSRSDQPLSGHKAGVQSVAFSPCGMRLVSGAEDKMIRVWDRKTGRTLFELAGHTQTVASVAFSPNGCSIVSGAYDMTVRLWNAKTGQSVGQPFTGHSASVRSVAFSPDGNYVISSSNDAAIRVWSLDTLHAGIEEVDLPNAFRWPTNPYELSSHLHRPGWVTHDQQSLAFWLPSEYQKPDQFLSTHAQTSSQAFLDYSKFVYGTNWTAVACDSAKHASV